MKNLNLFRKSARGSEGSTLASAVVRPSFGSRSTVVKHLAFMLLFLLGSLNVWGADVIDNAATSAKCSSTATNSWVSDFSRMSLIMLPLLLNAAAQQRILG